MTLFAYTFLTMFFLMAAVNIFLLIQIRARNRVQMMRGHAAASYAFKREQWTLATILLFFELSFFTRFLWDIWL